MLFQNKIDIPLVVCVGVCGGEPFNIFSKHLSKVHGGLSQVSAKQKKKRSF